MNRLRDFVPFAAAVAAVILATFTAAHEPSGEVAEQFEDIQESLDELAARELGERVVTETVTETITETIVQVLGAVEVSAGISVGNAACGRYEPTGSGTIDRDDPDQPFHFNIQIGPNGSCSGQGVGVDASFKQRFNVSDVVFGVIEAGFDQSTLGFEYVGCPPGFKCFHSENVQSPTLAFGGGVRFGPEDAWTASLALNAVDTPLATGKNLVPLVVSLSGVVFGFETDVTLRPHGLVELDVTREVPVGKDGDNSVTLTMRGSRNGHLLEHDAPYMLSGLTRASSPNPTIFVGAEWDFR